ncbi:unnamed protein product [Diamesa serratosioi]
MGCNNSKEVLNDNNENNLESEGNMSNNQNNMFKARLEKKLYLSRENPEPVFDLSDCNLENLPGSGLFTICKVLRKEELILKNNKLKSLKSGGVIQDLELIQVLDLSFNNFQTIPVEISSLTNLRELFLSNNLLFKLPSSINKLSKLELLDISNNNLTEITEINFLSQLRILNISGNTKITTLPSTLSTCDNLQDLIFDIDHVLSPSKDVLLSGTQNILKFLETGIKTYVDNSEDNLLRIQSKLTKPKTTQPEKCVNTFLEQERLAQAQDYLLENQIHKEQQKKREQLMKMLVDEQRHTESTVYQMQQEKDVERKRLIGDILEYEESSGVVIEKLLALKKEPDQALLELEDNARNLILERIHSEQSELRKKDVLAAMTELLDQELGAIQHYNNERTESNRVLIENETKSNLLLGTVFTEYDKNRSHIIDKLYDDEQIQKSAVATLISKNDARTWGLMEQIKIVEQQIAAMTNYEIDRKKVNQNEIINDICDKRMDLTFVLLDLMHQQDLRKQQLLETLSSMENQKTDDDFWLLQYQKLLDSRELMQTASSSIDPLLGYNFLMNGVIHVLPFLLKIWQNKEHSLEAITDDDLFNAGIKKANDRNGVLKSIREYLAVNSGSDCGGSMDDVAKEKVTPSAPENIPQSASSPVRENQTVIAVECVVCMDAETRVIFLPCGHLCCCVDCCADLQDCPMCRAMIERKIRVIQP